ncbi:ribonuclease HIII [Tigheibacillus jepli]|uniref:ribonuclease HIII n=1 Tax=Tigheibacillus jepli TaxID=3035914 RepID=UPI00387E16B3
MLPPDDLFSNSHIGTDEAGTGDYFGPITVAAAYVSKENIPLLKKIGVKDSKALTDDAIKRLAAAIIRMNVPNRVLILSNEKYNQLQKQGWSQGKMKGVLHQQAINELVEEIGESQLDGILIDQFCEPAVFKRYIVSESLSLQNNTYFMTKAESYSIAVATGSILARNAFLQEMEKLSEKVGMQLPKGASSMVDETIAKIIAAHGEAYLDACAKVHFANTKKGKRLL